MVVPHPNIQPTLILTAIFNQGFGVASISNCGFDPVNFMVWSWQLTSQIIVVRMVCDELHVALRISEVEGSAQTVSTRKTCVRKLPTGFSRTGSLANTRDVR